MKKNATNSTFFVRLIIILTLFTNSCNNSKNPSIKNGVGLKPEIIDLTSVKPVVDEIKLSEFAKNIEYIPLQYNQQSMLAGRNPIIQSDGNSIFIKDQGSIKQFSNSGIFIKSLFNVGRGPDECFCLDFTIDYDSSNIYVQPAYKRAFLRYNYNNLSKVQSEKIVSDENVESLFYWNRKLFISYYHNGISLFYLKVFDLDKNEVIYTTKNNFVYSKPVSRGSTAYPITEFPIQKFEESLVFKDMLSDTIFQTKDLIVIEPRYILNFGTKKLNYLEYLNCINALQPMKLGTLFLLNFFETKNDILFFLGESSGINFTKIFATYNKASKQIKFTYNGIIKNDIDNGPDIDINKQENLILSDNKYFLYVMIPAMEFKKLLNNGELSKRNVSDTSKNAALIKMINNINEMDNPVLMRIELKNLN